MSRREKRLRKSRWMSIGKHEKPTDENILQLITPSVLGIVLCMVCLAGMTWAWFTANSTAAVSKIEAAEYDVEVTVTTSPQSGTNDENTENVTRMTVSEKKEYTLEAGNAYNVTLTATGTATKGYCLMELSNEQGGSDQYYAYLKYGDSKSFTIYPSGTQTMKFDVSWKKAELSCLGEELKGGEVIGEAVTKSVANEDEDVAPSNTQEGNADGTDAVSGLGSDRTDTQQEESGITPAVPPQNPASDEDENNPSGTDDDTDTDGGAEALGGTDTSQDVDGEGADGLGDTAEPGPYSDQTEEFSPTN